MRGIEQNILTVLGTVVVVLVPVLTYVYSIGVDKEASVQTQTQLGLLSATVNEILVLSQSTKERVIRLETLYDLNKELNGTVDLKPVQ